MNRTCFREDFSAGSGFFGRSVDEDAQDLGRLCRSALAMTERRWAWLRHTVGRRFTSIEGALVTGA